MSEQKSPTAARKEQTYEPLPRDIWSRCYPQSEKVMLERDGLKIPAREVTLSEGEPSLHIYDTSGPQGVDVTQGLPALRAEWIQARGDVEEYEREFVVEALAENHLIPEGLKRKALAGKSCVTQLHYARKGIITPEMKFIAHREGVEPEFVRDEVAACRAVPLGAAPLAPVSIQRKGCNARGQRQRMGVSAARIAAATPRDN